LSDTLHNADVVRRSSAERYGVDPAELDAALLNRWQGGDAPPDAPVGVRRANSPARSRAFSSELITAGNVAAQPHPGRPDLPKPWS
jgi:hypothetical protein